MPVHSEDMGAIKDDAIAEMGEVRKALQQAEKDIEKKVAKSAATIDAQTKQVAALEQRLDKLASQKLQQVQQAFSPTSGLNAYQRQNIERDVAAQFRAQLKFQEQQNIARIKAGQDPSSASGTQSLQAAMAIIERSKAQQGQPHDQARPKIGDIYSFGRNQDRLHDLEQVRALISSSLNGSAGGILGALGSQVLGHATSIDKVGLARVTSIIGKGSAGISAADDQWFTETLNSNLRRQGLADASGVLTQKGLKAVGVGFTGSNSSPGARVAAGKLITNAFMMKSAHMFGSEMAINRLINGGVGALGAGATSLAADVGATARTVGATLAANPYTIGAAVVGAGFVGGANQYTSNISHELSSSTFAANSNIARLSALNAAYATPGYMPALSAKLDANERQVLRHFRARDKDRWFWTQEGAISSNEAQADAERMRLDMRLHGFSDQNRGKVDAMMKDEFTYGAWARNLKNPTDIITHTASNAWDKLLGRWDDMKNKRRAEIEVQLMTQEKKSIEEKMQRMESMPLHRVNTYENMLHLRAVEQNIWDRSMAWAQS